MENTERCVVHSKKKNSYYVKLTKNAKCDGCKACGFGRKNFLILPADSQIDCSVGDEVIISMPQKGIRGSYLYMYLLPLLTAFVGLIVPYGHGEKFMMIGFVAGLAVGIAVVAVIERVFRHSGKYIAKIISKCNNTEETENDRP